MGEHIDTDGRFQSDKYPTCPPGKVPLSTSDPLAQDLLWEYAQRRRVIDGEFSGDLETCLKADKFSATVFRYVGLSKGSLKTIQSAIEAHIESARKTMSQLMGHQSGMAMALAEMITADNDALDELKVVIGADTES